jgi:hypothetical protein
MSERKCGWCRVERGVWTDASGWHAEASCARGHVLDIDLCADCKALLDAEVQNCPVIDAHGYTCGKPLAYPEFTRR